MTDRSAQPATWLVWVKWRAGFGRYVAYLDGRSANPKRACYSLDGRKSAAADTDETKPNTTVVILDRMAWFVCKLNGLALAMPVSQPEFSCDAQD